MNAFERYPNLTRLINEYDAFGNFQDWQQFKSELNNVLRLKDDWISVNDQMPEKNIGVLVFIPDEDDHITSGMWDVDNKWVLLDDYRVPECEVTHWRIMPEQP